MRRLRRVLAPTLATALGTALAVTGSVEARASGGTSGSRIAITAHQSFSGYDTLTASNGTTYVGWISSDDNGTAGRQVHLCVLHYGASSCAGGVQTADALSTSQSTGLRVVDAGGTVELVWIAQVAPSTGDFSGNFGVATVTGDVLGASSAIPGAPTLGTLTSVIAPSSGEVSAAVIGNSVKDDTVYYYPTLSSTPTALQRPYFIGNAQLADNGQQTIMTTSQYGSLSGKVSMTSKGSGASTWKPFSNVAHSYTGGNIEQLRVASGHIWMLSMSDRALYTPYLWRWNGSSFGTPTATGDHHDVSSFDAFSDASGRLVNVSTEVGHLAVSNFGTGQKAVIFNLPVRETYAGGVAQISTSASGRGWVVYSVQTDTTTGDFLYAQQIHLSALTKTVHASGAAGRLSLTGPRSCLPMTTVPVKVAGHAAPHWKVVSTRLRLGSNKVRSSINGSNLKPSHHYTLTGQVVFAKGGHHSSLSKSLDFRTCGRP
jgi:hypothetical protein